MNHDQVSTSRVLDDELIERARQITGIQTKTGVIHEALRVLIQLHEQAGVRTLRGKLKWEGDLDQQREGRGLDAG